MTMADSDVLTVSGPVCGCSFCSGGTGFNASEETSLSASVDANAAVTASIAALLPEDTPKWGSATPGIGATVTYSFMLAAPSYAGIDERSGFATMNQAQKTAVRDALAAWSDVADVTFVEVSDAGSGGLIRLGTNNQHGISSGYAWYPGSVYQTSGDIYLANDSATNLSPTPGSYGYLTLLHEIGHAIGLKHPGNYNAGGTEGPYLPASEDSRQYSVMSYHEHPSLGSSGRATGPALYDIAAIQYLYGANTATRTGNDTYAFNGTGTPFSRSIWDAGGTDTIDASGQTSAVTISLVAGTFSSIGPNGSGGRAVDNVSIAAGVMIENAIGGRGNDTITGNAANNVLTGGAGIDTAVFSGSKLAYRWTTTGDTVTISGPDGRDSLNSIEILRFDDGSINLQAGTLVYRFYDTTRGTHFYTSSETERDAISATLPNYAYEGPAFAASDDGASVWRFYNTATATHFFTISETERAWVAANLPTYRFEGEAYKASVAPEEGLEPLYRFYNTQTGAHFYTADAAEAAAVQTSLPQFQAEGAAYYIGLL